MFGFNHCQDSTYSAVFSFSFETGSGLKDTVCNARTMRFRQDSTLGEMRRHVSGFTVLLAWEKGAAQGKSNSESWLLRCDVSAI